MRKMKKIFAFFVAVVVAAALMPQFGKQKCVEATFIPEGAEIHYVNNFGDLMEYATLTDSSDTDPVVIVLEEDITNVEKTIELFYGNVIIDLNGHTISGGTIFSSVITGETMDTSTLSIQDSSEGQTGKMENTLDTSGVIQKTGGTLNISSGTYVGDTQCIDISGCELNISGGTFSTTSKSGYTIRINEESTVNITDGNFESKYATVYAFGANNSITIEKGNFTANENGQFSFVCNISGENNIVDISGGTFTLNAEKGSSLVLGENISDENITISGGTYNGRIARMIPKETEWNYSYIYGFGDGTGILADGCILTDNTFVDNGEPSIFTADNVEVKSGYLVEFNTGRSALEEYTETETVEAENAEYYSIPPISIDVDGNVYQNSDSNTTPVINTDRVSNGNTYTFNGWCDENGTVYSSPDDFINSLETFDSSYVLSAEWDAKVSTADGLSSMVEKGNWVKNIEITANIDTDNTVALGDVEIPVERTLDLGNNTVTCSAEEGMAIVLKGIWNVKNGNIVSEKDSCILVDGTAILENLNCTSKNAECVVEFYVGADSSNRIISGTYENGNTDGYAIKATRIEEDGIAEDITNIFQDSYASTLKTKIDGPYVYLETSKLKVSQSPITYIGNGEDISLGTCMYGDEVTSLSQSVSNKEYVGDIIVSGVSVDNSVFEVAGEENNKILLGGSEDTYSYTVVAAKNTPPGSYTGTISVHYVRMDGTESTYNQTVTLLIEPKELSVNGTVVEKTKSYDKTVAVEVTMGELQGVIEGDEVSATAVAEYDSADAGTNKTITLKYILSGEDKDKYEALQNVIYTDGVINRISGVGSVTMSDYHVGEQPEEPIALSETNGEDNVTISYKSKGASDDLYTSDVPTDEGTYTVKAVFAETTNYLEVEATADFTVSYIDTPDVPYTISGTKSDLGWYNSSVIIYPADGYLISTEQEGTYTESYEVDSTASPIIYLKNQDGAVTRAIAVETISIDKEKPVIEGVSDGGVYYTDELSVKISDTNLKKVLVNGQPVNFESGSVVIVLEASDDKYTIKAEDMADNAVEYSFKVEKASKLSGVGSVTMSDYHVGEEPKEPIALSETNGEENVTISYKPKGASDDLYTSNVPTDEGTYTVKAVFAETTDYLEVEATADFTVSYIDTPDVPYTISGTKSDLGWYNSSVTIYPADGYLISTEQKGTYTDSYRVDSTALPVIYLKNQDGAVTRAIAVEKINIDKEKPVIEGVSDRGFYYDDELSVKITDANLNKLMVNGESVIFESGSAVIVLSPSDDKYTIKAEDMANNAVECSFWVEEAWMRDGIISSGIKKLKSTKTYKLGNGSWKVSGDNTVYNGGTNIYVPVDGDYDFQKQ